MKPLLLFPSDDTPRPAVLPNADVLGQDLELPTLFSVMADDDELLWEVASRVLLSPLVDPELIRYRQQAVEDGLQHPSVLRELYATATEAVDNEKRRFFGRFRDNPDSTLSGGVRLLELLVPTLRRLRTVADRHGGEFSSPAFSRFFAMLQEELSDTYLDEVETHVRNLQPRRGVELAARVGEVGNAIDYRVLRPRQNTWKDWIPTAITRSSYSFEIPPRDHAGFRALADMRGRGINEVANAIAQSADHVRSFFDALRGELAFYVGCLNLSERLAAKGEPICTPTVAGPAAPVLSATGLYDVCLTLQVDERVVGNDVDGDGKTVIMITGANRGGKSTFLRSVGLAQLMTQSGMFVPAAAFRGAAVSGIFTHYTRGEDETMQKGKLEEELARMSEIADGIHPGAMLLCNESFASTNEREGAEIGRQVLRAMAESGVRVCCVTHLYDLAHSFEEDERVLFLRAERRADGQRTFKLLEAGPLETSFGEDLYRRIFGSERAPDDRHS
jgi:DNA mismatch repair ATPase MutS